MKAKNNNVKTLDQFKDKHYGKVGAAKRDALEAGYENFPPFPRESFRVVLCFKPPPQNKSHFKQLYTVGYLAAKLL